MLGLYRNIFLNKKPLNFVFINLMDFTVTCTQSRVVIVEVVILCILSNGIYDIYIYVCFYSYRL